MAIAHVQHKGANAPYFANAMSVTLDDPVTAGHLLVVVCRFRVLDAYVVGMTDDAGNAYFRAGNVQASIGTGTYNVETWYAYNVNGKTSLTISIALSAPNRGGGCVAAEWSGFSASNPYDQAAGNSVASLTTPFDYSIGTLTPRTSESLVVMIVHWSFGIDATPPDSSDLGVTTCRYAILTDADPYAASWSFTQDGYATGHMAIFWATPPETWVDIADFVEQEISSAAFPGGAARVRAELWSEDTGSPLPVMKARLYDATHENSAGESPEISSATPSEVTFAVTLAPGTARYRLQVTADQTEKDLFAIGSGVIP